MCQIAPRHLTISKSTADAFFNHGVVPNGLQDRCALAALLAVLANGSLGADGALRVATESLAIFPLFEVASIDEGLLSLRNQLSETHRKHAAEMLEETGLAFAPGY